MRAITKKLIEQEEKISKLELELVTSRNTESAHCELFWEYQNKYEVLLKYVNDRQNKIRDLKEFILLCDEHSENRELQEKAVSRLYKLITGKNKKENKQNGRRKNRTIRPTETNSRG